MSNETKENDDQAEELRKLFNEVQEESEQSIPEEEIEEESHEVDEEGRDVDILELPPRREVHRITNKRTRVKISRASLRLIFVVITFLVLVGGAYYIWGQELTEVIINI